MELRSSRATAAVKQRELLPSPITHADDLGGERADAALRAPSAHRDGFGKLGGGGLRYDHLPPPVDKPFSMKAGACQPVLRSRLDPANDIRMQRRKTVLTDSNKVTGELEFECLVPAPFCRAVRADSRVRANSVSVAFEPTSRSLERSGLWQADVDETRLEMHQLRAMCIRLNRLVSGSREELEERIKLGFQVGALRNREAITAQLRLQPLSRLKFECAYRSLPQSGTKAELVKRLVERAIWYSSGGKEIIPAAIE